MNSSNLPESALERVSVEALDSILGKSFPVLDQGFVRVIDYMGSDAAIVQAARISYGAGTKQVREDRALIRYLMRHRHTTPFEMCEIKLHVRVPMDCWRQWIRHRTANVNEYSTRYSVAIDASARTKPGKWRLQSVQNRQGSEGYVSQAVGRVLSSEEKRLQELARRAYNKRLEEGVAREQARKDLPLSTYTEAYWKIDLHNLLHFLELRMSTQAQSEIAAYANIIGSDIVHEWCPITWEAFVDYRIESLTLSNVEVRIAKAINVGDLELAKNEARKAGLLEKLKGNRKRRDLVEIEQKLSRLGLVLPWKENG